MPQFSEGLPSSQPLMHKVSRRERRAGGGVGGWSDRSLAGEYLIIVAVKNMLDCNNDGYL